MEPPPTVYVEWVDSTRPENEWTSFEDVQKFIGNAAMVCYTSGFLLYEGEDKVVIAHSFHQDTEDVGEALGIIAIPRKAITAMEFLSGNVADVKFTLVPEHAAVAE